MAVRATSLHGTRAHSTEVGRGSSETDQGRSMQGVADEDDGGARRCKWDLDGGVLPSPEDGARGRGVGAHARTRLSSGISLHTCSYVGHGRLYVWSGVFFLFSATGSFRKPELPRKLRAALASISTRRRPRPRLLGTDVTGRNLLREGGRDATRAHALFQGG